MNKAKGNDMIARYMGKHYINELYAGVCIISPANHSHDFETREDVLKDVVEKIEKERSAQEDITNNPIWIDGDLNQTFINIVEFLNWKKENDL